MKQRHSFLTSVSPFLKVCLLAFTGLITPGFSSYTIRAQAAKSAGLGDQSTKSWSFEIVSIRQSNPAAHQNFSTSADGYHGTAMPLAVIVLAAYQPIGAAPGAFFTIDQLAGFPTWLLSERYDVDAKVSEADLPDWGKPDMQKVMLKSMLQNLLKDRLKLAVHQGTKEASIYLLEMGKSGPKFKETNPKEEHAGMGLPGGAKVVPDLANSVLRFYNISLPMLASFLSAPAGKPVQDRTGLTGRYDITLPRPSPNAANTFPDNMSDPGPTIFSAVDDLGLKLEAGKGQIETLVLDHVEKPSPN